MKRSFLAITIILIFILSISAISAEELSHGNENEMMADSQTAIDSDYQSDLIDRSADTIDSKILSDDDPHSFAELKESIDNAEGSIDLEYDYKYNNYNTSLNITKNGTFTINGNNHTINGMNIGRAMVFRSNGTVTVNDLTFENCTNTSFRVYSQTVFNNVKFINCSGGNDYYRLNFIQIEEGNNMTFNNCVFEMAEGNYTPVKAYSDSTVTISNSTFSGSFCDKNCVYMNRGNLLVENSTFTGIDSRIASAIDYRGWNLSIRNSRFIDLNSYLSAGAIIIKYFPNYIYGDEYFTPVGVIPNDRFIIKDCEFRNIASTNDGGAIHFDMDSGADHIIQELVISNCSFTNCSSRYGGAISGLGGILNISDSIFEDNYASFEGGAIYTSWSNLTLANSSLNRNAAEKTGGAIYFDKGKLSLRNTNLTGNKANEESSTAANSIYAYDVNADFADSSFDNGGISVYADFASDSKLTNISKNDDIFLLDNKNYIVSVESKGIKLNITNSSTISVDKLPSKFDAREWGWISPVKLQGDNDDCWAFATAASMEAALLKSTGTLYNLSQNYVQKLQLKYARNGDLRNSLTGFSYSGLGYALSWYGALEADNRYDDRGMIADTDLNVERIHLQDALIIFAGQNNTHDLIKEAIMKYGSVSVQSISDCDDIEINSTGDDIAVMDHSTHFVSFIGWDDASETWLVKESITGIHTYDYSFHNLLNTDYYAIIPQRAAIAYIFENDVDYHVNYQTDLTGLAGFDSNYAHYSNEFTSQYDEFIGAVGTYFNESGIDYSFDIYINNEKAYSQTGVSEFAGFRTIKLDEYIPVKTGDVFKVVFNSNALPYQAFSRQHYAANISMISDDGESWKDTSAENRTVCLKVYTVKEDKKVEPARTETVIEFKNMNTTAVAKADGRVGKYFEVTLRDSNGTALAHKEIKIGFNGRVYNKTTDENGKAKLQINLGYKGTYTFAIGFLGDEEYLGAFEVAKITVKVQTPKLTSPNKSYKASAKTKALTATFKTANGKAVSGKTIKFTVNGKTYTGKTNAKGVATVNVSINKKGTYSFTVKWAGDSTFAAASKKAKLTIK